MSTATLTHLSVSSGRTEHLLEIPCGLQGGSVLPRPLQEEFTNPWDRDVGGRGGRGVRRAEASTLASAGTAGGAAAPGVPSCGLLGRCICCSFRPPRPASCTPTLGAAPRPRSDPAAHRPQSPPQSGASSVCDPPHTRGTHRTIHSAPQVCVVRAHN